MEWYRILCGNLMSKCRVCGSSENVIGFDPRGLWAYFSRKTWCPEHCPDHTYTHHRYEGHLCDNCSQSPPADWYDYD